MAVIRGGGTELEVPNGTVVTIPLYKIARAQIVGYDSESGEVEYIDLATGERGKASQRDVAPLNPENPTLSGSSSNLSLTDVLARYRLGAEGGFGPVGSESAKTHAILAMAEIWKSTGVSQDEAYERATQTFEREFGATTPPTTVPAPPTSTPFGPGLNKGERITPINPFEQFLSETPGGRGAIGEEFLERTYPTAGGPFAGYLGRQVERQEPQYLLQAGLGQVSPDVSFMDYLGRGLGKTGNPPVDWKGAIDQASGFVQDPTGATGTPGQNAFAQWLRDNPEAERQMAIEAGRSGIAAPFQNAFKNFANRAYSTFSYNNPGQPWLPEYVRRGFRF